MTVKLEDIKNPEDGYLINCHLVCREDRAVTLFEQRANGILTAHLDGYAIIPIEEYEELKANQVIPLSDAISTINAQIIPTTQRR